MAASNPWAEHLTKLALLLDLSRPVFHLSFCCSTIFNGLFVICPGKLTQLTKLFLARYAWVRGEAIQLTQKDIWSLVSRQ